MKSTAKCSPAKAKWVLMVLAVALVATGSVAAEDMDGLWGSSLYSAELVTNGATVTGTFTRVEDPDAPPGKIAGQIDDSGALVAEWTFPVGPEQGSFSTVLSLAGQGSVLCGHRWHGESGFTSFSLRRAIDGQVPEYPDDETDDAELPADPPAPGTAVPPAPEVDEEALQADCLSNMKQLALAALMCAQDHDETMPPAAWVAALEPYHRAPAILRCPSRPDLPVAYAMNEKLVGVSLAAIDEPAKTILFFETTVAAPNPIGGPDLVPAGGIHNGGINVAYADGYCKWLPVDQVKAALSGGVSVAGLAPPATPGLNQLVICHSVNHGEPEGIADSFAPLPRVCCVIRFADQPAATAECLWTRDGEEYFRNRQDIKGTGWVSFSLGLPGDDNLSAGQYRATVSAGGRELGSRAFTIGGAPPGQQPAAPTAVAGTPAPVAGTPAPTQPAVRNRPPTAPTVTITPPNPTGGTALHCKAEGSVDPDGDAVKYRYAWYRNGKLMEDRKYAGLGATWTKDGQTWRCVVTPTDGKLDGPSAEATVTIGGAPAPVTPTPAPAPVQPAARNRPPTAPTVTITPANPIGGTALHCSATGSVDPDGDAVEYRYAWYRNGNLMEDRKYAGLGATWAKAGQTWRCVVTPTDGKLDGPSAEATVTIGGAPAPAAEPSVGEVVICRSTQDGEPVGIADTFVDVPKVRCFMRYANQPAMTVECLWTRDGEEYFRSRRDIKGTGWASFGIKLDGGSNLYKGQYRATISAGGQELGSCAFTIRKPTAPVTPTPAPQPTTPAPTTPGVATNQDWIELVHLSLICVTRDYHTRDNPLDPTQSATFSIPTKGDFRITYSRTMDDDATEGGLYWKNVPGSYGHSKWPGSGGSATDTPDPPPAAGGVLTTRTKGRRIGPAQDITIRVIPYHTPAGFAYGGTGRQFACSIDILIEYRPDGGTPAPDPAPAPAEQPATSAVQCDLTSPSASFAVKGEYPVSSGRLELTYRYTKPGAIIATIGMNAARVGDFVLRQVADGTVCWQIYNPGVQSAHRSGSGWHMLISGRKVPPQQWRHVAVTWGAGGMRMFFDQEQVAGDPVVLSLSGSQMYVGDCPGDNAHESMVGNITGLKLIR